MYSIIKKGISIVISTMREDSIKNVFENYKRQYFEPKEMIVVLNNNNMNLNTWRAEGKKYKNVKVFQIDESISLGNSLNYGIDHTKYDIITKFDDDDYYGEKYLIDSVKAFERTNADIVGKATSFVYFRSSKILAVRFPGRENRYVEHMHGSTLFIRRRVFKKVKFANIPKGVDTQFSKDCIRNGFKIYSTNKYHYVYIRDRSIKNHTWQISDEELLKYCTIVKKDIKDFKKFVNV